MSKRVVIAHLPWEGKDYLVHTLVEGEKPVELTALCREKETLLGNIYVGRVEKLAPGIRGAFVSFAEQQSCFLDLSRVKEVPEGHHRGHGAVLPNIGGGHTAAADGVRHGGKERCARLAVDRRGRCPSPLSGKSKRKGGTHVKLTRHNGRAGKNGVYNPKHNDRSFDIANSEHIDEERAKQNLYWDCYNGFRNFKNPEKENELSATFEDVEQLFYRQRYRDFVTGQNERNVKNRHPERNKETGDLLKSKKTCPEETVYQIGTLDNHVPPELLIEIVTEFMEIVNERFGSHVHILNWALHLDESTPHIHERHVFDCENQYGEIAPQQEKALEALGFELPEPEKPVGRKNNRKMTFDSACRVLLFDVAKKHGLQLEEEPEYGGRAYLEKQDYILFKQKEQLAAQEQKLEELTMKIEDVEALVDEVADIAYDKAVEVVADTVKLETHKEDIKLVEQSKAWVLSPERKASKKEVEYAVKRLDGVIARITNAMKSTIQKIQTTLMKPEVKKAGTEQIKKKAKSSIIEQLSRKKKEIAEREVSRTDQAKSKKQDMEL